MESNKENGNPDDSRNSVPASPHDPLDRDRSQLSDELKQRSNAPSAGVDDPRATGPTDARQPISDGHFGLFTVIGLLLLLSSWMWLKQWPMLSPSQQFSIVFNDVNGMSENSDVRLQGVKVGCVDRITLAGPHRVVCDVRVNGSKVAVPVGSHFQVIPENLIGARYVEIILPAKPGPEIANNSEVQGDDALRPELEIAALSRSLRSVDMREFSERMREDLDGLRNLSEHVAVLTNMVSPAAKRAPALEDQLLGLATELRSTNRSLRRIINDPNMGHNLTLTAQEVHSTVHELNQTLSDKGLRQDLVTCLSSLRDASSSLQQSVASLQGMSSDKSVRTDIKDILGKTQKIVTQVDELMSKKDTNPELSSTLSDTRQAIKHVDLAAQQMNQILDKKHPLMHMFFGRPGHVKPGETNQQTASDKNAVPR